MNCYRIKANGFEGLIIGKLSNIVASMPDGYLIEEAVSIGKGAYVNSTWDNNVKELFPPLESDSEESDSEELL